MPVGATFTVARRGNLRSVLPSPGGEGVAKRRMRWPRCIQPRPKWPTSSVMASRGIGHDSFSSRRSHSRPPPAPFAGGLRMTTVSAPGDRKGEAKRRAPLRRGGGRRNLRPCKGQPQSRKPKTCHSERAKRVEESYSPVLRRVRGKILRRLAAPQNDRSIRFSVVCRSCGDSALRALRRRFAHDHGLRAGRPQGSPLREAEGAPTRSGGRPYGEAEVAPTARRRSPLRRGGGRPYGEAEGAPTARRRAPLRRGGGRPYGEAEGAGTCVPFCLLLKEKP